MDKLMSIMVGRDIPMTYNIILLCNYKYSVVHQRYHNLLSWLKHYDINLRNVIYGPDLMFSYA